jgi:hypothetical protein
MSVIKCILGKVAAGKLTKEQGAEIQERLRRYEEKNRRGMNEEQAAALAAKQAMEGMGKDKARKARQTKLRLARQAELLKNKSQYGDDGHRWLLSEMDIDPWARNTSAPVKNLQDMHRNRAFAMMNDVLATFRPRLAGLRRPRAGADDMVRELHGQATGLETAKELADGFRSAAKYVWTEFNRYAGDTIAWRDDWGMPHVHDAVKVGSVRADQWADEVMPLLARDKMLDFDTGQPLSDAELRGLLMTMHDPIRTHGMSEMTPGAVGGKAVGNRRSDSRILQFKDGDAWLEYNGKYGAGDPVDSMINYIETMSRDIGLMQKFGPNPKAMVETLKDVVAIEDARLPVPEGAKGYMAQQSKATRARAVDNVYAQLSGSAAIPANAFWAGLFGATRSTLSGILLQSSTLSAVTDLNGQRLAYRMMGHGPIGAIAKSIPNLVRNFTAAMPNQQQLALHLSLGSESWSQTASSAARYTGDTAGPEWSRRFVDVTMRGIGLTPWTQGGKNVLGMDFYHLLHQNADKAFKDLPADLQHSFERFGIGNDYWNVIRKAEPHTASNGAMYVNPLNIFNGDDIGREAATRLQNMQLTLQKTGIIEVSPRVKAGIVGETKGGTIQGEVMRNIGLFKSFPLTFMHMQLFNAVQSQAGRGAYSRAKMAGSVVIGATMFGAVAAQMKDLANGRDPSDMNPATPEGRKFWGKAMAQGGGLSLFGDFLFADQNRYGKGFWASALGPVADLGDDIGKFTVGNVQQAVKGEDMDLAGDTVDMAKKYLPFGKMWYWKLAFERNVLDQLDMAADPKAHKRFRQTEQKYWKERKQKYWWRPGRQSPERTPDMGADSGQ